MEALFNNPYLWLSLSLGIYVFIDFVQRKTRFSLLNPLLFTIIIIIALLLFLDIPYEVYQDSGRYLSFFITPTTVSLAILLEKNFEYLKENVKAILTGVFVGVLMHTAIVVFFSLIFSYDASLFGTLFPKSTTTAIAVGITESLGGIVPLTVALVVITGVMGFIIIEPLLRLFKITDPVAQGIAIGLATHGMGTAKAIHIGEVQGAMSGLAIVLTGILTVMIAPIVQQFLLPL